jgi:hypothetical protein
MREIGVIKLVQVQRSSLKMRDGMRRFYDPSPLVEVDALHIEAGGVVGLLADGARIVDVHHAAHPGSRNRGGLNGVSVGFTAHYRSMRARFGEHLADGVAGENILVETARSVALADLGGRVMVRSRLTGATLLLDALQVAAPCVEFCHFAYGRADLAAEDVRDGLRFLHEGRRGFYASLAAGQSTGLVEAGDMIVVG